ncbi:alpha-2-macroglobulin family protein [Flavobacterium sp.]|uniref:alpha-2-macroglobulin family protein n=1 Tax=Flavobacterium sp. TaxID=239 RepID=UPI002B4AE024|nr:MG2 domain-containing protein [Flavobacterium sp.]HLP63460.1 MG2 domain-containing protein [Flavobacterium sp.]
MKTIKLIGLFLAIFVLHSCTKKSVADFDSDFSLYKDYISSFSTGMVSVDSDIRVQLAFNKSDWEKDEELDDDLFEISPSISGKVVALSNNTIAFIPKDKLEQNTLYRVTLNLSKITNKVPKELSKFNFSLKTFKQDFVVNTNDLQSYNRDSYYLNGTIKTADNLSFEDAKKLISATQNGDDLKISFDKSFSTSTEFKFTIENIKREDEDGKITIEWDGDDVDIDQEGEMDVIIPGKDNFKVLKIEVGDENNQSLLINFSDPLKKDQDFKGLINIQNTNNLKFSTMGNVLKVFFNNENSPKVDTSQELQAVVDTAAVAVDTVATAYTESAVDSTAVVEPVVEETIEATAVAPVVEQSFDSNRLIEIFQGIESAYGYKLKENYSENLIFEQIKPGVRFLKSGNILPSSNNLKINFEAANLKSLDVKVYKIYKNNILQFLQDNELNGTRNLKQVGQPIAKSTIDLKQNNLANYSKWNAYALDISKIIQPEPGAIYRVEFSFKKKYSLYKCTSNPDGEDEEEEEEEIVEDDVNYSGGNYYDDYYYDEYDWREDQDPCSNYYYYNTKVGTNILATDLGVIVKRGTDKSIVVAVNNIVTTETVSGATVDLYNFQQQKIASSRTNGDGMATFEMTKYAYFAIVTQGKHSTYVKLDDELSLSVSNFDVSGETLQKGLKGYIYGERGVWRPGDTMYLSFILNDNANKLPENHPIKLRLNDPNGKTVYQTVKRGNSLNHYTFVIPTETSAPTGNWEAVVNVGGARFYKSIKVETIKPNRLKIKNSFNQPVLSAAKKNVNNIQVLWLHGAIAKDLKTEVQAKFSQQVTTFKGFTNYVFDDPTRSFSTEEINIFSGKVDANGKASIPINPTIQGQAPGMLRAAFITKVYENGGDVSTDVSSTQYSPYKTYVGIKAPEPNRYGMYETGKNNNFSIVTVDENGRPKRTTDLEIRVYKLESRWWWDASNNDLSNYNTAVGRVAYKNYILSTDASGRGSVNLNVPNDEWGNYLVRVYDPTDKHATGVSVYLDWPYWSAKSKNTDGESAKMLKFSTDKTKYNVGDKAKIFFPSSEGGRALISIENGTKVVQTLWAKTQKGETQVELPITGEMAPNVYINITLLQPHASTKNDSPIRMYGIVPIEVIDKNTVLEPQISMPNVLRPEQTFSVKVSEKQGKAMTYTIAVVDEGLLDLTRFKTPNAWDSFYTREALGVRTWDIYDDVIGAYGGKVNQVFSIGGDADLGGGKAKKANRFKPVVMYFGPFELGKGDSKTHQIKLPKYIGSVRTMVVAAQAESSAYGMAEKATPVKSPLMVLASLPRKISPSENVTIPVTVFATENHVKNVTVQIKPNNSARVIGSSTQQLSFPTPDEKMAYFNLQVGSATGIGKIDIIATSGKEKSTYSVEIDVTNPNPRTNAYTDIVVEPNSSKTIAWKTFGVSGSNKASMEVSSVPTVDFGRRLDYLIQYPHGCVEQTTSSVFPQLYLADIMDIDASRKQNIQRNITAAIQKLGNFQQPSGGLSYWPGTMQADDWGTSYAGHFLIEAEKKGYALPINFKTKWISYQQKMAKQWRFEKGYGNDLAQAYRLYTLALAGSADVASMNRLRETVGITNESKLRLAATYALIKQNSAGLALLSKSFIDEQNDTNGYYYYYGSADRNRAMALETLVLLGQKQRAFKMATQLAKNLSSDQWMSTQTTAYGLYAMSKFAKSNGSKGLSIQYTNAGKAQLITTTKTVAERSLVIKTGGNSVTIKNTKNNTIFVRVLNSGILPVGSEKPIQNNLTASVTFKDRKGNLVSVTKIKQGTEFIAEVTLKNGKNERVNNIALTQILPSGFEIVNTRYTEFGSATENVADYIDIRDDRANYYFSLSGGETRKFKMLLNASYLGKYYLPGLQCEAMYDNDFLARTQGQWVEVIK